MNNNEQRDNPQCRSLSDSLVAYADRELGQGELDGGEQKQVAEHLAGCRNCREELAALEDSLAIARDLWSEAAENSRQKHDLQPSRRHQSSARSAKSLGSYAAAISAVVVLAVLGGWFYQSLQNSDIGSASRIAQNDPKTNKTTPPPVPAPNPVTQEADNTQDEEFQDIRMLVSLASRKARLAATIEILGDEPDMAPYRERAQEYLDTSFGE